MDLFKQNNGMKGPARPAPAVPTMGVNRYSPVTNWNDDPFGADVFEPMPQYNQKKLPPPRPPPPKINNNPDVPVKPSHFTRKPTVLSTLLNRRNNSKTTAPSNNAVNTQNLHMDFGSEIEANRMFPKCEPKNLQTGTLIDLSSPPSSPTFTTRSSSDGLSVDSFSSDATTSTNHNNMMNGGNASQAESGFEDDFDLFLTTRKPIAKDDTLDDFAAVDPFSPQIITKPPIMKKPVLNRDLFELSTTNATIQPPVSALKGPTIIRAKPARPKPPDNSALLKNTFGSNFPVIPMTVNTTTTPIQKVCNGFGDSFESKLPSWDDQPTPEREASPPMPAGPPPPPPPAVLDVPDWQTDDQEEPYAIALYDYFTDHEDDLSFSAQSKIALLRRVDNEWFFGRTRSGAEGLFPASYVEVRIAPPVSTPVTAVPPTPAPRTAVPAATATALYDFPGVEAADLPFSAGDRIAVLNHVSAEWAYGECRGRRGQFPLNYVQTD